MPLCMVCTTEDLNLHMIVQAASMSEVVRYQTDENFNLCVVSQAICE